MSYETVVDRYCEAWSASDPEERKALLDAVWAEGATYTDPTVHAVGAAALLDHIAGVLARRPGARVVRTSELQVHHEVARFAWQVSKPDGAVLPEGLDVAIFEETGKIARIIGFFGPLGHRA